MLNSSDFMELESQRLTLEEIIEDLKQDQINLIEISGMRGIGKTTMVYKVLERVEEEKLFDEVCFLNVSVYRDPERDPEVIKQMVVDHFDKADMRKDRKILVVLDSIGVKFNLHDLKSRWGYSHRTFKILYTSRIQGIRWDLPHRKEIALGLLSDDDALKLFRFPVDSLVDTSHLLPLAKKIVNVCGGLPHLLVTISWKVWNRCCWPTTEDSLEVMKCKLEVIECKLEDMLESLTSRITNPFPSMSLLDVETASSNYKEMDKKAHGLFLLCCLFEREKSIRVEDLARCALGLRLFHEIHDNYFDEVMFLHTNLGNHLDEVRFLHDNLGNHLDEVRERVYTWVDYLKEKYFLRDGKDHEHVAVPALVRTIGMFVASSAGCLVRHGAVFEWRDNADHYSNISVISGEITELPAGLIGIGDKPKIRFLLLECSNLKSLDLLHQKWELKVLFLKYFNGTLTLPSQRRLQMLALEYCPGDVCKNISGLGNLYILRMLSFRGSGIKELPEEIGNMRFLQLLDLRETFALNRIPPGVISGLVFLEELHLMGSDFVDWEGVDEEDPRNRRIRLAYEELRPRIVRGEMESKPSIALELFGSDSEKEGRNASLYEFVCLRRLKTLDIYVRRDVTVPEVDVLSRFTINEPIS